ncbi:hypothetical protein ACFLUO_02185 [Chloroflexota bacterium]
MKTKHSCGLLAILILCVLFTPFPAHADGEALEWVQIDTPGLRGNIVVRDSEVNEIAVGRSGTIYALDSANDVVYLSNNGGATWDDITSRLVTAGAGVPFSKVAIAPDTTSTVAVVTDSATEVYLSIDEGATWTVTNVPSLAGTIQTIAISKQYTEAEESVREIAIGTADWGDTTTSGQVWVYQLGLVSSWRDQSLTVDPTYVGGEVSAIAYSPSYQRDSTIIVVASTGDDVAADYRNKTRLCLGKRDTEGGTTNWDYFSGYPVEIATASSPSAGDAVGVTGIYSSLALPSNYSSRDEDSRKLFVSYDRDPVDANDDVYRLIDTTTYRLNANASAAIDISSIAYYGTITSGKLLAGDVNPVAGSPTVRVRRTSNPFDSPPSWNLAALSPSGPGSAKVSWSSNGGTAYCGTSQSPGDELDESAFSASSDDGDNWQQLSLMDTTIKLSDIALSPDSGTLFAATYSQYGPEGIWRSTSTQLGLGWYWSRQVTMDTSSDKVILRLSPDYASDYTIYAAEAGGTLMSVSHNRGNSWKTRRALDSVIDIVVEDENTLYSALSGGRISKSTDSAFTWEESVRTGLSDINMLTIVEKGTILVGGRNGEVAYSTDGGASFTRIDKNIGTGDVQVVADAGYQENGIIYAATDASDNGIWRWAIGLSTKWEQIDEPITALETGQHIAALAMGSEGALYALRLEAADDNGGGITRSLNPATRYDTEVEFDFTNAALPTGTTFDPTAVFSNTLPNLKMSGHSGQNDLWAIDTANEIIYRFQDTLAAGAPALVAPTDGFTNPVNLITGKANEIAFAWNRMSEATSYKIYVAYDSAFDETVTSVSRDDDDVVVTLPLGPGRSGDQLVDFMPGTTYYWRVKVTEPLLSYYSEVRSFTVEPVAALVLNLLSPANGDINVSRMPSFSWEPVSGATEYQFLLADNSDLAAPLVDTGISTAGFAMAKELEFGKTYFWAVKAVAPVEGGQSAIANFTVKEEPIVAEPGLPVVVEKVSPQVINIPATSPPPEIVIPPSPPLPVPIVPAYIWATIIVCAILLVAVIILIVKTRRPF